MVVPGVALADAVLHQTGKAGQHRNGGIDAHKIQAAVQDDLALGDVAGEIGDRVGDVVVGHGENGNLGHRAIVAVDNSGPFVKGGQLGVEVAGVTLTAGDLSLGGGKLPEGFGVGGHVG